MPQGKSRQRKNKRQSRRRPRVLVLEALRGSSRCVAKAGGVAIKGDPRQGHAMTLDTILNGEYEGLLLTGGPDIDPRLYGEKKQNKKVYGVNQVRDRTEKLALEEAERRGVPVLGICRGAQIINAVAGGTLKQHIGDKHRNSSHIVNVDPRTALGKAAGDRLWVVSLHHQMVERLAPGYVVSSRAPDGTNESIESADGRVMGVQFHPEEDPNADYSRAIFRWIVVESARRAHLQTPAWPKKEAPGPSRFRGIGSSWQNASLAWADYDDYDMIGPPDELDEDNWLVEWFSTGRNKTLPAVSSTRGQENRSAGTQRYGRHVATAPVTYRWFCNCHGMEFDKKQDRDDHVAFYETGLITGLAKQEADG